MIWLSLKREGSGRIIRDDSGSALVLALVFISVIGLIISSLMSLADARLRSAIAVRDQGIEVYASDGAMDEAIAWLRGQINEGRFGGSCPNFISSTTRPSGQTVTTTVVCEALPGSGVPPPGYISNRPDQAILTLSTETVTVKGIEQKSNNVLIVHGDVWSNSDIDADAGASSVFNVVGTVKIRDSCQGVIDATVVLCDTGLRRADPLYEMATTVSPLPALLPNCALFPTVVELVPGLYSDAGALSAITKPSGGSACSGKVIWFRPGVYYFDFVNAGGHLWQIGTGSRDNRADVVAGTPTNLGGPWPFPGSCRRDDLPVATVPGVQFIFGGDSQLSVESGDTEICASAIPGAQQIALFGVTQTAGSGLSSVTSTLVPTSAISTASASRAAYLPPMPNGLLIDGVTANAALTATLNTAEIISTGYCSPCIPVGSVIQSVFLRLAHRDANGVADVTATVGYAGGSVVISDGSNPCNNATTLCLHNNLATDSIDLMALGLDTPAELNAGVTVTYSSRRTSGTPTDRFDGAHIEVTSALPGGFRRQSGALLTGSASPVLQTSGPSTGLSIHGTVYAPLSGVDIFLNNASAEVIDRGIVSRYLKVALTGSSTPGVSISIPGEPRADRRLVLRATLDDGVVQRLRTRAVISYVDSCVPSPCSAGERVTVESWSVIR